MKKLSSGQKQHLTQAGFTKTYCHSKEIIIKQGKNIHSFQGAKVWVKVYTYSKIH